MFRISQLAFGFLVCFLAVSAEESQDQDLSNIVSDLASLRRDVRSPGVSTKKKSKKGEKKARRKKKKGPSSKRRTAKNNSKRPKKKSGSNQNRRKNNGRKNIQRKPKSKKPKSKRKSKKKPQKIKIAKKNNRRRTKPRKCNRQNGADDGTCSANIETAMDYEGKQIKNFNNQKKRIEDFDKLMKNKGGKKENFQNTTKYMKEALGSDNSCNGTTNKTDAQTAVSTHTTLSNCSTSVGAGCSIPSSTYNTTELASCETSFTAVTTKNAECYKLTTATSPDLSAACTCWAAAATLVETTKALKCSAVSSYQSMTALKTTCLSKFSECKKAEDASVGLIQVCNGRTTPSTASVPSPAPAPAAPSPAVSPSTAAPVPTPYAAPVTTTSAAAPTTSTAAASPTTTTAAAAPTTTAAAGATTTASASETTTASASETTTASASETATASASETTTASESETTTATGCKCGVKRTSRIVGGTETEVNEYPWMAAVATSSEFFFCGGTLIASQWVLTAAHCMFKDQAGTQPQTAAELKIVLGEHDIASTSESQIPRKVVQVSQIINHPSYSASTSNNDIALLKLSEEVDLNTYTPSCMPATSDNFEGQKAWLYGWGTTSSGGATSDKLLEVEVPVVSNTVCNAAMSVDITDAMLCAGGELNKDGCQGDSGGPLTVEVSGKHVLIGDVSFGNGCGLAGQYGVYGDVAYFRSWVDTTVSNNGGAKYCPA